MEEEATAEYRMLTFMLPRYRLTHFLLGRAYAETCQPEGAIQAYNVATRLNPESVLTYNQRALVYASIGQS